MTDDDRFIATLAKQWLPEPDFTDKQANDAIYAAFRLIQMVENHKVLSETEEDEQIHGWGSGSPLQTYQRSEFVHQITALLPESLTPDTRKNALRKFAEELPDNHPGFDHPKDWNELVASHYAPRLALHYKACQKRARQQSARAPRNRGPKIARRTLGRKLRPEE